LAAQLSLPGKKVRGVGIAVAIGVALAIAAVVATPLGEIDGVDVEVAIEVGWEARRDGQHDIIAVAA
jgi:hypothetical protein